MRALPTVLLFGVVCAAASAPALAQTSAKKSDQTTAQTPAKPGAAQRPNDGVGALLYESNCQTCHLSQVHWRDKRIVTDWDSLRQQVGRWQTTLGLRWSGEQVSQVAAYLNLRYYKFSAPQKASGDAPGAGALNVLVLPEKAASGISAVSAVSARR